MPDLPDLKGRVRVDTSDLSAAVGRASRAGSLIGSALGTLGGNVASGLLDTAFSGVKALTVGAVTAASDLQETANKISTVFGPAAATIQQFSQGTASSLGLSRQAALDAAATFGVFGKSAGLTGKDLSGFSTNFVKLASDMASFSNTTPEEAIEALGSGLRGEAEPLRRYGVLLDDATLRQEAVRLGITKTTKEALTPQQKVLAAQAAIMKQTGDAQGDFARTSDGLANRTRIAKAEFADLQTKLGTGFLPIVNLLMGALVKLFGPLGELATVVSTSIGPLFERLTSGGGQVGGVLAQLRSSLAGLGAALGSAFQLVLPTIMSLAAAVRDQVLPAIQRMWSIIATNVIPALSELVSALAPVARWLLQAFGPIVVAALKLVFTSIGTLMGIIGNLVKFVARVIKGDWSGAWQALKAAASGAMQLIAGQIRAWLGGILPAVFRAARSILSGIWSGIWGFLKNAASSGVSNVMGIIRGIPGRIRSALGNLGSLLYGAGRALIQGLINGIRAMFGAVGSAASSIASKIRSFFPGSPVKEGPLRSWNNGGAGKRLGGMLVEGLLDQQGSAASAARSLAAATATGLGASAPVSGAVSGSSRTLAPVAATVAAPSVGVRVFIGSRELSDIVRVELDESFDTISRTLEVLPG